MLRVLSTILAFGLAGPAAGQLLSPAIEADGSQTQTLELLDGAVSVELDSSGSLSLGNGQAALEGALGATANDVTIGGAVGGSVGDNETPPAHQQVNGDAGTAAPVPVVTGQSAASQPGGLLPIENLSEVAPSHLGGWLPTVSPSEAAPSSEADRLARCETAMLDEDRVMEALNAGKTVQVELTSCVGSDSSAARIVAAYDPLSAALAASGIRPEQVFSITFTDKHVKLHGTSTP